MSEKIALITGASRGLGAALAEALAATHHIVAVGRTTGALEELDDRIKATGHDNAYFPLFWDRRARRCSLTIRARGTNSLVPMAPPRPRRSRWRKAGRRKPSRPGRACMC